LTGLGTKEFWQRLLGDPTALAAEVCSIDVANLDETLQKQPALRAWVNAAYEVARINEERRKWDVTKARARAFIQAKTEVDPETGKPLSKTIATLEAEVETNPDVLEATGKLLSQQEIKGVLRAMANALEDRKDMLIQIAAKQRAEMKDYR